MSFIHLFHDAVTASKDNPTSGMENTTITTYLLTELSPSWEAANCAVIQEIPNNFMKPEGSSLCSQEASIGPYPEPVRSSSYNYNFYKLFKSGHGVFLRL
jgi:hypothetical protein